MLQGFVGQKGSLVEWKDMEAGNRGRRGRLWFPQRPSGCCAEEDRQETVLEAVEILWRKLVNPAGLGEGMERVWVLEMSER